MNELRVNGQRLWEKLMQLARIGETLAGGVHRLALSREDRDARDWFAAECSALGCETSVDRMGNLFARFPGVDDELPAVLLGSHLDSQPTGGKFDGTLGLLAGLEVLTVLKERGVEPDRSIELVSWTNEEGARFAPAMLGSGVFAGEFTEGYAYSRADPDGVTVEESLRAIGYQGQSLAQREYDASFELHIEQGPILEAEDAVIGVVTGVQGIRWYDLRVVGEETHAGPFPMSMRRDPVRLTTQLISMLYEQVEALDEDARLTVGYLNTRPGVRNTVPGEVVVAVDLRHPDASRLLELDARLRSLVADSIQDGFSINLEEIWHSPPVRFADSCVTSVRQATQRLGYAHRDIVSGAGHDAVYVSKVIPTSMIFIPCERGLSHNEQENITLEHAEAGANVLLHATLATSKR